MKRFILILLVLAMLVSMAACTSKAPTSTNPPPGETDSSGTPQTSEEAPPPPDDVEPWTLDPNEDNSLSVTLFSNQTTPNAGNRLSQQLKDELGVTLTYEIISRSDTEAKIGTMLVGGIFNDIIGTTDLNNRFHEAGAIIRLDEYLDSGHIPLLYEHVQPYRARLSWDGGDGVGEPGFYIFPDFNRFYGGIPKNEHDMSAFYIQKAVLEAEGYPPTTPISLETYFGWMEKYMAENPQIDGLDTIGFIILSAPDKEFAIQNPPEHLAGFPNDGNVIVDNNKVVMFYDQDIAKNWYKFLNDADKKGLVYRESFTLTYDDYLAQLARGNVLGMFDQWWNFGDARNALISEKRIDRTWAPCEVVYDNVTTPWYGEVPVLGANQGMGVSSTAAKNGKVEKCLAFLNHIMEEKWQKRFTWGMEGVDYEVVDGRFTRNEQQVENHKDPTWRLNYRLEAFQALMPKHEGYFSDGNSFDPITQPEEFYNGLTDYDKNFLSQYGLKNWRGFVTSPLESPVYYPVWKISLPTGSEAKIAETELKNLSLRYLPEAILCPADQFEKVWAEYCAQIGRVNVEEYVAYLQEKVDIKIAAAGG